MRKYRLICSDREVRPFESTGDAPAIPDIGHEHCGYQTAIQRLEGLLTHL